MSMDPEKNGDHFSGTRSLRIHIYSKKVKGTKFDFI